MAKKKTERKQRVPRTRNAGTMTEAQFWSMIRSTLRERSKYWKPVSLARLLVRRKYTGPNKRQRYEYQCNDCENWFDVKKINVDHIIPAGSLSSANDLPAFVERLFCEVDGLQVLCEKCHNNKTKSEKLKKKK